MIQHYVRVRLQCPLLSVGVVRGFRRRVVGRRLRTIFLCCADTSQCRARQCLHGLHGRREAQSSTKRLLPGVIRRRAHLRYGVGDCLLPLLHRQCFRDSLSAAAVRALSRAKLIARDQTSKMNGAFNQARQTSLGIDRYVWQTSGDERVREEHQANDGQVFSWNDPPATGHPGEDINCRCVAVPYFDLDSEEELLGL